MHSINVPAVCIDVQNKLLECSIFVITVCSGSAPVAVTTAEHSIYFNSYIGSIYSSVQVHSQLLTCAAGLSGFLCPVSVSVVASSVSMADSKHEVSDPD